ncbi:hypothetical protein AaE_009617 [Aphanomyces astaci]|uniref:Uncharacterized protein n=2 Tax=Aphanomyces astaci TaxID=112090 RepID=A0A6A5A4E8_APHAT|nr:hypothetical protein AaE_009617 [Aphanomyces astaci]
MGSTTPWMQLLALIEGGPCSGKPHPDANTSIVGCRFSVVKNPPRFCFVPWRRRPPNATLFLNVGACVISVDTKSGGSIEMINAVDVHMEPMGVRRVELLHHAVFPTTTCTIYEFENPVYTVEFTATVHLMQHMVYIRARKPKSFEARHDSMLMTHMQNTIAYATTMWTLALWNALFPYSHLKETLEDALAALHTDVHLALTHLDATYCQFYAHAAVTDVAYDAACPRHYRASYVALLVAKVKALHTHVSQYCKSTATSDAISPSMQ